MLFANFIDAILKTSWLAHQSAHKTSFSQRFWSAISEISPKSLQNLITGTGSKTNCLCFCDLMPVLWVHRVITHAFPCYICKPLDFYVNPAVRHCCNSWNHWIFSKISILSHISVKFKFKFQAFLIFLMSKWHLFVCVIAVSLRLELYLVWWTNSNVGWVSYPDLILI